MASIELRAAAPADAEAIGDVFLAARAGMDYLPRLHSDAETRAWLAGVVLPGSAVTVAVVDGLVTGFCAVDGAVVEHLYVHPRGHGRGIGSALLDHAKQGGAELTLHVFQRNTGARRFYERHGFAAVAFTDGAGNEEREPDVLYRWTRSG
jgi:ribosomal protein S18 acetylase RimI-like enzyme